MDTTMGANGVAEIKKTSRSFRVKIYRFSNNTVGSLLADDVLNLKMNRTSSDGEDITIGQAFPAGVEFETVNALGVYDGQMIHIRLYVRVNGSYDGYYVPLFTGTITSSKKSGAGYAYAAYDKLYTEGSQPIPAQTTTDITTVCNNIAYSLGVTFNSSKSDMYPYGSARQSDVSNIIQMTEGMYTRAEAIGYLAGIYGCNAYINRTGELVFKAHLNATLGYALEDRVQDESYEYTSSIGKVTVDGNEKLTADRVVDGSKNGIIYCKNPIALNPDLVAKRVANRLDGGINVLYKGSVQMMLGDPRLDPWDIVEHYACNELVMDFDGGLSCEIESIVKTDQERQIIEQDRIKALKDSMNDLEKDVESLNNATDNDKNYIHEDGTFQLGGANGIKFDGYTLTMGQDVTINYNQISDPPDIPEEVNVDELSRNNIIDEKDLRSWKKETTSVVVDYDEETGSYVIDYSGTTSSYYGIQRSIKIEPDKEYTISFETVGEFTGFNYTLSNSPTDLNSFGQAYGPGVNAKLISSREFTYINMYFYYQNGKLCYVKNLKLEYGDHVAEYENIMTPERVTQISQNEISTAIINCGNLNADTDIYGPNIYAGRNREHKLLKDGTAQIGGTNGIRFTPSDNKVRFGSDVVLSWDNISDADDHIPDIPEYDEGNLIEDDDLRRWTKESDNVTVNYNEDNDYYEISYSGTVTSYYGVRRNIKVEPNQKYTLSFDSCGTVGVSFNTANSATSTGMIKGTFYASTTRTRRSLTVTTTSSNYYVTIYIYFDTSSNSSYNVAKIANVQLEKGDTATDFESPMASIKTATQISKYEISVAELNADNIKSGIIAGITFNSLTNDSEKTQLQILQGMYANSGSTRVVNSKTYYGGIYERKGVLHAIYDTVKGAVQAYDGVIAPSAAGELHVAGSLVYLEADGPNGNNKSMQGYNGYTGTRFFTFDPINWTIVFNGKVSGKGMEEYAKASDIPNISSTTYTPSVSSPFSALSGSIKKYTGLGFAVVTIRLTINTAMTAGTTYTAFTNSNIKPATIPASLSCVWYGTATRLKSVVQAYVNTSGALIVSPTVDIAGEGYLAISGSYLI